MIDKERLEVLLAEAVVDCYDEEEEFWGLLATLDMQLCFPLQAELLGEQVEVTGLSEARSSRHRGIVANIRKGNRPYTATLADLTFVNPDAMSAEWLAAYKYWLGENQEWDE